MIHTPAASVYVNFSSAAKNERKLLPAFLWGGLIGGAMSILAGIIGMETLAKFGSGAELESYQKITRLATDIITIARGGKESVRVTMVPNRVDTALAEQTPAYRQIAFARTSRRHDEQPQEHRCPHSTLGFCLRDRRERFG